MMALDETPIGNVVELRAAVGDPRPRVARHPIRWADLEGKTPPERAWRINHWLSLGVTLLSGAGGIGKTLLAQQIATALALGRNYIDEIPAPCNVLMWACEDDHDELWRREVAIAGHFGATLSDLEGVLTIEPRLGRDNALFTVESGVPQWTMLRDELGAQVEDYRADVLILDNIGQLFAGSENDRHHVTSFVNGLAGLARDRQLSVILLGHPAKIQGSEFSGSTAWENAVRMRWFLTTHLPDEKLPEADADAERSDIRFLCKRKTNYSVKDYRPLKYVAGVLKVDVDDKSITDHYSAAQRAEAAEGQIEYALRRLTDVGLRTSDARTSPAYLPKMMRERNLDGGFTQGEISAALIKMRMSGRVQEGVCGRRANRQPLMGLVVE